MHNHYCNEGFEWLSCKKARSLVYFSGSFSPFLYKRAKLWLRQYAALSVIIVYKVHYTRYQVTPYLWRNKSILECCDVSWCYFRLKLWNFSDERKWVTFQTKLSKEIIKGSFSTNWLAWLKLQSVVVYHFWWRNYFLF